MAAAATTIFSDQEPWRGSRRRKNKKKVWFQWGCVNTGPVSKKTSWHSFINCERTFFVQTGFPTLIRFAFINSILASEMFWRNSCSKWLMWVNQRLLLQCLVRLWIQSVHCSRGILLRCPKMQPNRVIEVQQLLGGWISLLNQLLDDPKVTYLSFSLPLLFVYLYLGQSACLTVCLC